MKRFFYILLLCFFISIVLFLVVAKSLSNNEIVNLKSETTKFAIGKIIENQDNTIKYEFYSGDNKRFEGYFENYPSSLINGCNNLIIIYNSEMPEVNQIKDDYLYNKFGYFMLYLFIFIAVVSASAVSKYIFYIMRINKCETDNKIKNSKKDIFDRQIFGLSYKMLFYTYLIISIAILFTGLFQIYSQGFEIGSVMFFVISLSFGLFALIYYFKMKKE